MPLSQDPSSLSPVRSTGLREGAGGGQCARWNGGQNPYRTGSDTVAQPKPGLAPWPCRDLNRPERSRSRGAGRTGKPTDRLVRAHSRVRYRAGVRGRFAPCWRHPYITKNPGVSRDGTPPPRDGVAPVAPGSRCALISPVILVPLAPLVRRWGALGSWWVWCHLCCPSTSSTIDTTQH